MNRCGRCDNCQFVKKEQEHVLKAVNDAANKGRAVDDVVVATWNDVLERFPCREWEEPSMTELWEAMKRRKR